MTRRRCEHWKPDPAHVDRNFREALVAVLRPTDYAKFPKMDALLDKRVLVQGKFVLYEERPEIELTKPTQIKIITAKP